MVKTRLIACLLWRSGMLVQSQGFSHTNSVGSADIAAEFFTTWAVDEIILLDVTRSRESREEFHESLKRLSRHCFVPLTVGGWIESIDEIRRLLSEGADKVVLNTTAFENHKLLSEAAKTFGRQCIVISIDAKRAGGGHKVWIDRGRRETTSEAVDWAKEAEKLGAGEIFLTSIDQDGSRNGYDLALIRAVSDGVNLPVIASGGVGTWQHLADGINEGHADAISAANIFHYSEQSTKKAKDFLFNKGIDVRRPEFYKINLPRRPIYRV